MHRSLPLFVTLFLSLVVYSEFVLAESTQRVNFDGHKVLRFSLTSQDKQAKESLAHLIREFGLDLWAEHPKWVDVRLPVNLVKQVDALGLPYRVMISNLQELIDLEQRAVQAAANATFFATYRTWNEFNKFIDDLVKDYPHLVTKQAIGTSLQKRKFYGITITSKNNHPKVGIVYNGGQHAREWISPMTNAYIAYELVTKYGVDSKITQLVDEIEWNIIPIVNPDGYVYTWETDRMWRKNRRINENSWFGCLGVDTNRNWAYQWNKGGSSGNTCADDYHGTGPFSEPEETSLAQFIQKLHNVQGYIDFHAYSQLWMIPWGYTNTLPKDYTTQMAAAKACVAALEAVYGTPYEYGPIATTIYPASGSSADWTYGVANITYSFAVELRDTGTYGFLLPADQIVPTGTETMEAVKAMAEYILAQQTKKKGQSA